MGIPASLVYFLPSAYGGAYRYFEISLGRMFPTTYDVLDMYVEEPQTTAYRAARDVIPFALVVGVRIDS